MTGGPGGATSGAGGVLTLSGGNATAGVSAGGNVVIQGGTATSTGAASTISITSGAAAGAAVAGGALTVTSGAGNTTGAGGLIRLVGGQGGATGAGAGISLTTGAGGSTSGASGALTVLTGNVTSGTAGSILLDVGTSSTGQGSILVGTAARAQTITIGNVTGATALNLTAGTGNINLQVTAVHNGNILAANVATGTTGTATAVAGVNTTTIALLAAGAFANNDVIFINNAGQDFYTRITAGGGTTTLTVSPAISYDASAPITKYTIQNIGATAADYTTQTQRFFQGYFLGGVVTGAGSTTLSDQNLTSTGALYLNTGGSTARLTIDSTGLVGVGTAPVTGRALTVNGTISATAGNRLQLVASGNTNLWNIDNGAGTLRIFRENFAATGNGAGGVVYLSVTDAGAASFGGTLSVSGTVNSIGNLSVNSKEAISGADTWLRLNNSAAFSSGVYTPGLMRVDGTLQQSTGNGATTITNPGGGIGSRILTTSSTGVAAYFENVAGTLRFVNAAYSLATFNIDQVGNLSVPGSISGNIISAAAMAGAVNNTTICWGNLGALASCTSTRAQKHNIANIGYGINELRQLRPVNFDWNADNRADNGFIAEEVALILPETTQYNVDGSVKSFNYNSVLPVVTRALQQLDVQVQTNQARLAVIESGEFAGDIHVVGDAQIGGKLTVTGDTIVQQITINGKIITAGTAPTIAAGLAAGDALTATATVTGNDTAGTLSITTGAVGTIAGEVLSEVTFNTPYTQAPIVTVSPTTEDSASIRFFLIKTTTGWSIKVLDAPVANKTYSFDYHVIQ